MVSQRGPINRLQTTNIILIINLTFMGTFLLILMMVLILAYIMLIVYTIKREKQRNRQLLDKVNEFDRRVKHLKHNIELENDEIAMLSDKLADLRKVKASYDELLESYNSIKRQYENPGKRYIINNLVRLYKVENFTNLAKALGVSPSSLCQKLKKA